MNRSSRRHPHPCEAWIIWDTRLQRPAGVSHFDLGGTLTPGLVSEEMLAIEPEMTRFRIDKGITVMNYLLASASVRRIRYASPSGERYVRLCIVHRRELEDSDVESDERPKCAGC